MSNEWVSRTTWDGKELIFVRQHHCFELDSSSLLDIAESRIRECDYERQHWISLLEKREQFIKDKKEEKLNV